MADEPKQDEELDELYSGLADAEKQRRRRALMLGLAVAVFAAAVFGLIFKFRAEVFTPKLDIEGGEEDVIELTNDPQCRAFIDEVTAIGEDYEEVEQDFEPMLDAKPEEVREIRAEIAELKERLDAAEKSSLDANLRFDNSRSELDDWFDHVQNELRLLDILAEEQLPAETTADAGSADAGSAAEKDEKKPKSKKTPEQRLDGALLAIDESFQSFRVWHTGGLHPCGAAEDGEEPWTPPAGAKGSAKDGAGEPASNGRTGE